MPQLGETVTEGTITKWHKQVGDAVDEDEVLFEVSTDKVDSEVPSPVNGTITEILVPEGETVSVGTKLAVIGQAGQAAATGAASGAAEASAGDGASQAPAEPETAAADAVEVPVGVGEGSAPGSATGERDGESRPGGAAGLQARAPRLRPNRPWAARPGQVRVLLTSVPRARRPRAGRANFCRPWSAG